MKRADLADLVAFSVVAEEGSFTRAAGRLAMSQSALSHAMRSLEERLGVPLLSRTTRRVATTEAGEELLRSLSPAFKEIELGLLLLGANRSKAAGTVRLTMSEHAALQLIRPILSSFIDAYPDINVEVDANDGFVDIIAERFDAGIRRGEHLQKDMVALRLSPDTRVTVVASPAYIALRGKPNEPRGLHDHRCIGYRLATSGAVHAWEFEKRGRKVEVRHDGQLVFNSLHLMLAAVEEGQGIAYLFEDQVTSQLENGSVVRMLESWCPSFPGYYISYPRQRLMSSAFAALLGVLRANR